jgi:hypothetical protein
MAATWYDLMLFIDLNYLISCHTKAPWFVGSFMMGDIKNSAGWILFLGNSCGKTVGDSCEIQWKSRFILGNGQLWLPFICAFSFFPSKHQTNGRGA